MFRYIEYKILVIRQYILCEIDEWLEYVGVHSVVAASNALLDVLRSSVQMTVLQSNK